MSSPNQSKPDFQTSALPDLSPFRIDPDHFSTLSHVSGEGRPYTTYLLTVESRRLNGKKFVVEVFRRDAERLRVLQYQVGDGYLSANARIKKDEDAFDTYEFTESGK